VTTILSFLIVVGIINVTAGLVIIVDGLKLISKMLKTIHEADELIKRLEGRK
jgi:hypothetical protein